MEIKSLPPMAQNLALDAPSKPSPPAARRDFAEVLEGRAPEEQPNEQKHEAQRSSEQHTERSTHKRATQRDEPPPEFDRADGLMLPVLRTDVFSELPEAREILPHDDIARMVSVIRTLPGGQREVTLELTGSVLEGLRVKLQATATGRVKIDFMAQSEHIKQLLDARVSELSDLLRTHRINLAEVKTSLSASAEHGRQRDQQTARHRDDRAGQTSEHNHTSQRLDSSVAVETNPEAKADLWRA